MESDIVARRSINSYTLAKNNLLCHLNWGSQVSLKIMLVTCRQWPSRQSSGSHQVAVCSLKMTSYTYFLFYAHFAAVAAATRSQVVCSTFTYAKQVCSSSHSVSQETCVSASMLFLHSLQWCQHTWQALIDFYSLFYVKLNRLLPKAVTGNHQIVFEILICISAE